MMKDDLGGGIMEGFVKLHLKMYSFKKENNEEGGRQKEPQNVNANKNLSLMTIKIV